MRITPLDVRKQEFRKVVRGLDADEVYAFLATIADEYETTLSDNKQLRERLLDLDEKVNEYRNMEKTLRDTLLTAERVMSDARANANKEADLILRDAHLKAEQETSNIAARVEELKAQLRELRGHRDAFLARLKGLSEAQIGLVGSYQKEFDREDANISIQARSPMPAAVAPREQVADEPRTEVAPTPPAVPVQSQAISAEPHSEPDAQPEPEVEAEPIRTPPLTTDPPDVWRNYIVGAKEQQHNQTQQPQTDLVAEMVQEFEEEARSGHPNETVASSAASIEEPSQEADGELAEDPQSSEILEPAGAGNENPAAASPGGWSMKRFTQGLGEV